MSSGLRSRTWRLLAFAMALALGLGMLPGLLSSAPAAAQADELSQREFDNLVEDAQAGDPVYGPEDGELEHDPDRVTMENGDLDVSDFLATVTFQNPYAGTRQQFDYGIQFRSHDESGDARFLRFIVISDGTWGLTDGTDDVIQTGQYDDFDGSRRGENDLILYVEGDVAHIGIDGDYVASIEVPFDDAGDISVGTSFLDDSFEEGAVTEFSEFTVWEIGGGASSGKKKTPTPEEDETPIAEGTEYESPTYGYTLTYDDTWEVTADESDRTGDSLELDNGVSNLQFFGTDTDETPAECVDALIDSLQSEDAVTDLSVALDEDDNELRGEVDDGEFVVLQVTMDGDQGQAELTMYYSCLPIVDGESMLGITHVTSADAYNDEVENRAAVLDTLSIEGESTTPGKKKTPTAEADEPTAEATTSDLPEGSITLILEAVEQDGPLVFGTLVPDGDQTEVSLIVLPTEPGVSYDVTINSGTCRRPGATEFEVGSANANGLLKEVVDAPVEDLSGGDFVMIVSDGGDPDAAIACGVIEPLPEE